MLKFLKLVAFIVVAVVVLSIFAAFGLKQRPSSSSSIQPPAAAPRPAAAPAATQSAPATAPAEEKAEAEKLVQSLQRAGDVCDVRLSGTLVVATAGPNFGRRAYKEKIGVAILLQKWGQANGGAKYVHVSFRDATTNKEVATLNGISNLFDVK